MSKSDTTKCGESGREAMWLEARCQEPYHWDDGIPYCDTCGMFRWSHNRSRLVIHAEHQQDDIDYLRDEILRLKAENEKLRASRDDWSRKALDVQRQLTARLCRAGASS